jgi:hypothetical protein
MTRAPNLTPSWLPRQQRRRVNRQLRELMDRDVCSVCSKALKHNGITAYGLDTHGNVCVAGECCLGQVVITFGRGFFSTRRYDFLQPRGAKPDSNPTNEQITDAIAAYQQAIADADKLFDGIERRGGVGGVGSLRARGICLLDHPWKDDDRIWFEQNPTRSHRMRTPFPGELDGVEIQAERRAIVLVRQVEPGSRLRAVLDPDVLLLPGSPHDEAFAHALFEVAVGHEPMPSNPQALAALIEKYSAHRESDQ